MHKYHHISFIRDFFKLLGSFLSKNLKKRFSYNGTEKKNKLECLFIFSGGNCTLNLKISQIIFFYFFSEMVWILQVFKRLWQASMHTACQKFHFLSKKSTRHYEKIEFFGSKVDFWHHSDPKENFCPKNSSIKLQSIIFGQKMNF